jgi:hypothetical protein
MFRGVERETVAKSKKAKQEKKLAATMLPNLSGIKFEDAVRAFAQTRPPKIKKAGKL